MSSISNTVRHFAFPVGFFQANLSNPIPRSSLNAHEHWQFESSSYRYRVELGGVRPIHQFLGVSKDRNMTEMFTERRSGIFSVGNLFGKERRG